MANLVDRCKFRAASGGVGTFTVSSAAAGYMTPASANAVDGALYSYAAQLTDASGNISAWEVGTGTYTASGATLTRSVQFSSNSNATVSFASAPLVTLTPLAADFEAPPGSVNVRQYGAVGDGVTDDLAAINAALASIPNGGTVFFPDTGGNPTVYGISDTIVMESSQRLQGVNKRLTKIKALSSFPINTAMVQWGTSGPVFDTALYDMWLDANLIAGSLCLYSNQANEGCGLFRCIVENSLDTAVFWDSGCEHFGNFDIEIILTNADSNYGIKIGNGTDNVGPININRITIGGRGIGNTTAGIYVRDAPLSSFVFSDVHLESMTDGILVEGDNPQGICAYVDSEVVANTVHLTGASDVVLLNTANFFGTNNILVDDSTSLTIPNTLTPLLIWSRDPVYSNFTALTTLTAGVSPFYTVLSTDTVIAHDPSPASWQAVSLPDPSLNVGRELEFISVLGLQRIVSILDDVRTITGATPSVTGVIISEKQAAGSWAVLKSDGTYWRIIEQSEMVSDCTRVVSTPYTVDEYDTTLLCEAGTATSVVLPSASLWVGRELQFVNYQNNTVVSSTANVTDLTASSTSAILAGTAGKWAILKSRDDSWQVIAGN